MPAAYILLQQFSRNKSKAELKNFQGHCWESNPGRPSTKPMSQRVNSLTQLSEIDYILEAMRNLPYVDI